MNKNNASKNSLKELEAQFNKKLDWQFYVTMALLLMIVGGNYYVLRNFANKVNEIIKFEPIKGIEFPMIRSA